LGESAAVAQQSHTLEWIAVSLAVALFGLGGVVVLLSSMKDVWRALGSPGWPGVPAEVVRSEVEAEAYRESDGSSGTMYTARLVFAYEVDGRAYTTSIIRFGESLGSGDPSEPELQRLRYPEGARVRVAYDPKNPAVAVARPGLRPSGLAPLFAGVALLVAAAFVFLAGRLMLSDAPVLPLVLKLMVAVFVLIGLGLGAAGAFNLKDARASTSWPVAWGRIVFQQGGESESRWEDSSGRRQGATTYSRSVVYAFEVAGITHYANARRFGQIAGAGEEWAREIADRYPVGASVEVRYHPTDPDRAVLEPGLTWDVLWLPGIGLAFLLFGLAAGAWWVPALTKGW
jgi:hypothetical protein